MSGRLHHQPESEASGVKVAIKVDSTRLPHHSSTFFVIQNSRRVRSVSEIQLRLDSAISKF